MEDPKAWLRSWLALHRGGETTGIRFSFLEKFAKCMNDIAVGLSRSVRLTHRELVAFKFIPFSFFSMKLAGKSRIASRCAVR
jgi:hypothetical protein